MKYLLWAGTLGVLALFGFILSNILSVSHPSLAEQTVESGSPNSQSATTPLITSTPSERFSAAEPLAESTQEAVSPTPSLDDPKKAAALQELLKAKSEMQNLRPPQVESSDPTLIAGSINAYVNQMGQRAQNFNRARAALQEQLSPAETTRLNQILTQSPEAGHP